MYRSFEEMANACRTKTRRMAVAGAADGPVLESVLRAADDRIAVPILIGDPDAIRKALEDMERDPEAYEILPAADAAECGITAVRAVRDGMADFLMKGMIETRDLLKPLVHKENGLATGRTMCVFSYNEVPQMSRLLALSDGGMIPYPTLEQKKDIILNTAEALHKLGVPDPKMALLCAVEKVNPKMTETVDADALVQMNRSGEIEGCTLVGPISFDIAMSKEIAAHKGYECPYCGDFDAVIVPTMVAGNLMHKAMILCGGTKMAGVITGAKVPAVLTSRGASAEEKYMSIVLASLLS